MSPLGNYPQLQFACLLILGALLGAFGIEAHAEMAPLPSWNEGPAKQAIVTFVKKTTDQAGPKFVPPSERIAVFDNDRSTKMHCHMKLLAALAFSAAALLGDAAASNAQQSSVTAIDIALEPDDTMLQHAKADNARLRKDFPKGFSLDGTHSLHVTLLQRFVRTADLDKIYDATDKVLASEKVASWKLKAFKYYYIPNPPIGLAGIVAQPRDDLLRLQKKLIEAIRPFTAKTGTAAAFFTTPEEPDVNKPTIDYVVAFVPKAAGKNFNPHVTIGVGTIPYLKKMLAEPFDTFTFSPAAASVYQLGNFGTARKQLKTFQLK